MIFAGGFGTRLSEATNLIPKPMVEIGGKPILWHIMKIYAQYGVHDFILCCGYKQYVIKEYFANYFRHNSDLQVDLATNTVKVLATHSEKWNVTIVDTGLDTMTGGRLKRVQKYVGNETFFLTYGDGVSDVNIMDTLESHKKSGKVLSMMAYQPTGKLGVLEIDGDGVVKRFVEKPKTTGSWINAGFFVCEPQIFDFLYGDDEMFEKEPMQRLLVQNEVHAYKYEGFWKPMDTLHDCQELNRMWDEGKALWKVW